MDIDNTRNCPKYDSDSKVREIVYGLVYLGMNKNTFFILTIIFFFNCQGKSQEDLFPKYEFRSFDNLVEEEVIFTPYSIKIPKDFKKFNKENLDVLKNQIENDSESYFRKVLVNGFSDTSNTALMISIIKQNDVLEKLNQNFLNYLESINSRVNRTQYSINSTKVVQYQIKNTMNNMGYTNLKIFIINRDFHNYMLDFIIMDRNFNNKLSSIESSLSTLTRNKKR